MEKRTSIPANALIWFGAGVSLAEILTGTFFAPLGFRDGGIAIVVGHIIGCALLFLAGLIGARVQRRLVRQLERTKYGLRRATGELYAVKNARPEYLARLLFQFQIAINEIIGGDCF